MQQAFLTDQSEFKSLGETDNIKIIVDHREDDFFVEILLSLGAEVEKKQLSVADFLCSFRLAVERKSRSDFEQSIIDGRLFSQIPNLIENYERSVIIVEGTADEGRINRNALLGSYATIIADYGISLFFTKDKESTAELVFHLAKHEQMAKKHPMRIYARRKTLTPSQTARAVMESLPNIGPKSAKALLLKFGDLKNVFDANEKELAEEIGPKKAKIIKALLSQKYEEKEDKFSESSNY